ncbi:MAG: efflux RND transporter periplasmic adaptor subunit [Alphaproteobacteria bacterium]
MKRNVVLLLSAVFLLVSCGEENKVEQEVMRPAKIMTVEAEDKENVKNFSGTVEATEETTLSFQVAGKLYNLPVLEGQVVTKGDVIAELDPTDFKRDVAEAEVRLKQLKQELFRKKELYSHGGFASKSAYDDAQTEYDLQVINLAKTKQNLEYTKILAPFDLVIAKKYVSNFKNVEIGEPVVLVQDMSKVDIGFAITENMVAKASDISNYHAYAVFSFMPEKMFPIIYKEHMTSPDEATQTYKFIFSMDRPRDFRIFAGMSATILVKMSKDEDNNYVKIPATAVVPSEDGKLFVWVVNDDGSVGRRDIETEGIYSDTLHVVQGLNEGERIVATGGDFLRENQKVHQMDLE